MNKQAVQTCRRAAAETIDPRNPMFTRIYRRLKREWHRVPWNKRAEYREKVMT